MLSSKPTLEEAIARVALERWFWHATPAADRSVIAGIPHVRAARGEFVPLFEIPAHEMERRPAAEMAVTAGGAL